MENFNLYNLPDDVLFKSNESFYEFVEQVIRARNGSTFCDPTRVAKWCFMIYLNSKLHKYVFDNQFTVNEFLKKTIIF
jgi:hypothetical protein